VLWLNKGESVPSAVELLEQNATAIGLGQIYYGPTLALNYGVGGWAPGQDPRTPDIIVTPNVGVTHSRHQTLLVNPSPRSGQPASDAPSRGRPFFSLSGVLELHSQQHAQGGPK
jgi:hypothetical protein